MQSLDHNWYAVRIAGQATSVHRRRVFVAGPKGGLHRFLVPDINHKTNIEVAFDGLGVEYFLPIVVHETPHRRKRKMTVVNRTPIIPGYVFVRYVPDWQKLEKTAGVIGVLKSGLNNVRIPHKDIYDLRLIEWQAYMDYIDPPKKRVKRRFIEGSRHSSRHKTLGEISFEVLSVTNRNTIKIFADKLGKFEVSVDDMEKAA